MIGRGRCRSRRASRHVIHLVTVGEGSTIREEFDQRVLPFERARATHRVDVIPRSPLGKLGRGCSLAAEITK